VKQRYRTIEILHTVRLNAKIISRPFYLNQRAITEHRGMASGDRDKYQPRPRKIPNDDKELCNQLLKL